jgi:hypothetical protein
VRLEGPEAADLATVRPLGPVQVGAVMGWVWSGGSNLAPGPLGPVVGDPDRHRAPGLAPRPLLRTSSWRPGDEAARVLGSWASAAALSTGFGNGAAPHALLALRIPDRRRSPSTSHFHNLARSCADSDWRSSVNQGRGSLFRHATGCLYYPVEIWAVQ